MPTLLWLGNAKPEMFTVLYDVMETSYKTARELT